MSDRLELFSNKLDELCEAANIPFADRRAETTDATNHVIVFEWDLPFNLAVPHDADVNALTAEMLGQAYNYKKNLIEAIEIMRANS